jgi:hypothetical protein
MAEARRLHAAGRSIQQIIQELNVRNTTEKIQKMGIFAG